MSDQFTDRETERNNERVAGVTRDDERAPSVVETVQDAVSTFARPLAATRSSAEDAAAQRIENDAEQRG